MQKPSLRTCVALTLLALCSQVLLAERPNILLIVSEDNGPELGCYGEPYVRTPVLDELAAEGVRFDKAFVPQAGCSQSRAALLTGLYPHQNGQIGLATWKFRLYREDTPNLVRSLKDAGYRTGIIGKLHINPASAFPFDMHEIPDSNFGRKNLDAYTVHASTFFESKQPFFLSVNYPDAHRPFIKQTNDLPTNPLTANDVKPLAYFGLDTKELRDQTANYYNCMSRLDSFVGDLLEALQESGKAENTLVIYMGDHGADLLRGKRTSYEGGLRVPLIVRWPKRTTPGLVRQELISTLDLMPTILAVANATPVKTLPGQSLLPLLTANTNAPWREYLFTEFHLHSAHNYFPQRTVRDERYKLIQNLLPNEINPGYEFTLNRFFPNLSKAIDAAPAHIRNAYQRMETPPAFELYDLKSDPYEFHNLADSEDHANKLTELKHQLEQWRNSTDDPLLESKNVQKLKSEIDACFVDGKAEKSRLNLSYPTYFFEQRPVIVR